MRTEGDGRFGMKPENQALTVVLVAFAVVVAAGGVYLFTVPAVPSTSLPIPAGTAISRDVGYAWVAHLSVPFEGGRLVGSWTAYGVHIGDSLKVANGTLASPVAYFCPHGPGPPHEVNGTLDMPLDPGAYTIYAYSCSQVSKIVITETIQIVPNSFLG